MSSKQMDLSIVTMNWRIFPKNRLYRVIYSIEGSGHYW